MIVIFCLSAQNGEESSELSGSFVMSMLNWMGITISEALLRTFAHMLEFMGLSVLLFNATYAIWENKITPIIAFTGTVLYAITDEIHQIFVPERAFQVSDILVDSTGALIGVTASFVILNFILFMMKRRNKNGNS
jgi:VanZ family protein